MSISKLNLRGKLVMYADDLSLVYTEKDLELIEKDMNSDLFKIVWYSNKSRLFKNAKKTQFIVFKGQKRKSTELRITLGSKSITQVEELKLLGVTFSASFLFETHIDLLSTEANRRISMMARLRKVLPSSVLNRLYKTTIQPLFTYCSTIWSNSADIHLNKLKILQKAAARVISNEYRYSPSEPLFTKLEWTPIKDVWEKRCNIMIHRLALGETPRMLKNFIIRKISNSVRRCKDIDDYTVYGKPAKNRFYGNSIFSGGLNIYNKLPMSIRELNFTDFCDAI